MVLQEADRTQALSPGWARESLSLTQAWGKMLASRLNEPVLLLRAHRLNQRPDRVCMECMCAGACPAWVLWNCTRPSAMITGLEF